MHFHEARDENPHLELRLQTVNRQKEILGDTPIRRSVPLEIPCRTWRIFVIAVRGDEYLAVRDSRGRELGKQPHAVGSRRIVGRRTAKDVVRDILRIEREELRLNTALLVRVPCEWQQHPDDAGTGFVAVR